MKNRDQTSGDFDQFGSLPGVGSAADTVNRKCVALSFDEQISMFLKE